MLFCMGCGNILCYYDSDVLCGLLELQNSFQLQYRKNMIGIAHNRIGQSFLTIYRVTINMTLL